MVVSLEAATKGPKALLRLAVCTIDALKAVLAAWLASVVAIVEITWVELSGAIEDASVVIEKQILGWVAFGAEVGGVLAVLASVIIARVAC